MKARYNETERPVIKAKRNESDWHPTLNYFPRGLLRLTNYKTELGAGHQARGSRFASGFCDIFVRDSGFCR